MRGETNRRKHHRGHNPLRELSARDLIMSLLVMLEACLLCYILRALNTDGGYEGFVPLIFVLAVVVISRFSDGYFWGMAASVAGVVCVNYVFTYPYMAFNFTIAGYPLTFLVMLGVSAIVSGMTTQIKRQEQLRSEAERETMRANLLRAVSHDIRTPLTSIVGSTEALLEAGESISRTQQEKLLRDMNEDAQWLIRIVENLLSITRINGETTNLDKSLEAPEEIMGGAVQKFRKRFPQMKVDVQAPEEFFLVPMDPILIEQVILNLLENAMIHGETVQRIRLQVERSGDTAVFSVQDDGKGFPAESLPRVFEGMSRSMRSSRVDGKKNMEIGLSTCQAIIKAHGGQMTAENSKKGGACVKFILPMEEAYHEDS